MRKHSAGPWNRGYGQNIYQGERADPSGRQRLIASQIADGYVFIPSYTTTTVTE